MKDELAEALDALARCAAEITGFAPDAIQPSSLQRFLARALANGVSAVEMSERARRRDAEFVRKLAEYVTVGETYFFRHPEQFELVVSQLLKSFDWSRPFRAWSAGCATGEEAWSIAACLLAHAPAGASFEVHGSDILARNVAVAEAGLYGSWSVRRLTPLLWPVLEPESDGRYRVIDVLRPHARFRVGNLLETSAEEGPFDLVFCRNVLVYFAEDTRREAVRRIRSTLAPNGLMFFGAMDVDGTPEGFVRAGPAELQVYARTDSPRFRPPEKSPAPLPRAVPVSQPPPPRARPPAPSVPPTPRPVPAAIIAPPAPAPVIAKKKAAPASVTDGEPLMLHLEALLLMERGADRDAARVLDELVLAAPEYVAGLLERALLYQRQNSLKAATELMRRVHELTRDHAPDEELPGPEPLPARFYMDSAAAFLSRRDGGAP